MSYLKIRKTYLVISLVFFKKHIVCYFKYFRDFWSRAAFLMQVLKNMIKFIYSEKAFSEYMNFKIVLSLDLFKYLAVGSLIMWSSWEEHSCCQNWANQKNSNYFDSNAMQYLWYLLFPLSIQFQYVVSRERQWSRIILILKGVFFCSCIFHLFWHAIVTTF